MRRVNVGASLAFFPIFCGHVFSQSTATFWRDYPRCSENCHMQLFPSSGCPLTDSCLCENSVWLQNNAACIAIHCPGELQTSAYICDNACNGAGYPMAISPNDFIVYGEAASKAASLSVSASTPTALASISSTGK